MARIAVDRDRIADFCRRHHIRKLSFFGSVLRDDFGPESDVDLLVEFEPGKEPSLLGMARMEFELEAILGVNREVELRTPEDLSRHFVARVLASAELLYAA